MSYDSSTNSTSDSDRPPAADDEEKKPFVEPRLRRETDLIDGTGTTVSWNGD